MINLKDNQTERLGDVITGMSRSRTGRSKSSPSDERLCGVLRHSERSAASCVIPSAAQRPVSFRAQRSGVEESV